jgi:hypothetical protein
MSAFGVRADIVIDDFNRNNRPSSRVYRPLEIRVNITHPAPGECQRVARQGAQETQVGLQTSWSQNAVSVVAKFMLTS